MEGPFPACPAPDLAPCPVRALTQPSAVREAGRPWGLLQPGSAQPDHEAHPALHLALEVGLGAALRRERPFPARAPGLALAPLRQGKARQLPVRAPDLCLPEDPLGLGQLRPVWDFLGALAPCPLVGPSAGHHAL